MSESYSNSPNDLISNIFPVQWDEIFVPSKKKKKRAVARGELQSHTTDAGTGENRNLLILRQKIYWGGGGEGVSYHLQKSKNAINLGKRKKVALAWHRFPPVSGNNPVRACVNPAA